MRLGVFALGSALVIASLAAVACSSSPAAPVDPGKDWQDGGAGSGGGGCVQGTVCPDAGGSGGAAGGAAGTAGAAGSTGGAPPDYPAGPYGFSKGAVASDFSWWGLMDPKSVNYVADETTLTKISMHDFYNPTNEPTKPKVLRMTESALWCSVCKEEAKTANANYLYWKDKGVVFMELLFQDVNNKPAQPSDLHTWTNNYKYEFPSALDPDLLLGSFFNQSASPFNMIIDLTTMKIVYSTEGMIDTSNTSTIFDEALAGK